MGRMTILAAVLLAGVASAETVERRVLPEVMVLPAAGEGWVLSYRNGLSGAERPDREVGRREVAPGEWIVWEIARTANDACAPACPDLIRVLSVPEGFAAWPVGAEVPEGAGLTIVIRPPLLG